MLSGTDSRRRWLWLAGPVLVSLASAAYLALHAREYAPIQPGDSAAFWSAACGVELPALHDESRRTPRVSSGFVDARIVGGWAYYEWPHMHGSYLYALPLEAALADYDAVLASLEAARRDGDTRVAVRGYTEWMSNVSRSRRPEVLLEYIADARREELKRIDPVGLAVNWSGEEVFWHRWRHSHWYWANLLFEWLYLTGLALFLVWPGLRGGSIYRWAAHLALFPLLAHLPAYLGYGAGFRFWRDGSVLYPYLLHHLRLDGVRAPQDAWLIQRTPQVLEPLSGMPWGPYLDGRYGQLGPTVALGIGVLLAATLLLGYVGYQAYAQRAFRKRPEASTASKPPAESSGPVARGGAGN